MLWGGTNPPTPTESKETYLNSVLAFACRMHQAGVDAELSDHAFRDHGPQRMTEPRAAPGSSEDHFVLGTSGAQLFTRVMKNMPRGRSTQDQESATATSSATTTRVAGCGC